MQKEQEERDLLQGLDLIPWENLEHAYGSARDVPDLLRNLLNPDPEVRKKTIWALYGNVFHQGTRYPATPYVVPFLIRMCASPEDTFAAARCMAACQLA